MKPNQSKKGHLNSKRPANMQKIRLILRADSTGFSSQVKPELLMKIGLELYIVRYWKGLWRESPESYLQETLDNLN